MVQFMNCICDSMSLFSLYMLLALSEDGMFVHVNVPKLIFMLQICELIAQDSVTAYLEAYS